MSQAIAHFVVHKEGGLSQVKKMLQEGEKEEIRISVSLLKNISRYRELHADIGELPLYTNIRKRHMAVF